MTVRSVHPEQAFGGEGPGVVCEGLDCQQMHWHRIAVERVDDQVVEGLWRAARLLVGQRETCVTGDDLDIGSAVPEEMKQATEQMQLCAEFSTHSAGFDR